MQSLFAIVMEMNENERRIWTDPQMNQTDIPYLKTMAEYLHIISLKLSQANFHSNVDDVLIDS